MLLATLGFTGAGAQDLTAILTHGQTSKTYIGKSAFKEAYADATHGDLITLSSGTFDAVTEFEKALTIRGAGMEEDTLYHTLPTIIYGDMTLNIPSTVTQNFHMEGIYHEYVLWYKAATNPEFVKCRLSGFAYDKWTEDGVTYYGTIDNASFFHCKIVRELDCYANSTIRCINCYIRHPQVQNTETSYFNFINCVIYATESSSIWRLNSNSSGQIQNSTLTNCIIHGNYYYSDQTTNFTNCVLFGKTPDVTRNSYWNCNNLANVFKSYTGSYSNTEKFELNGTAKNTYVDDNGREVGINGGAFPFTSRLAGPHIQEVMVAPRSTSDGKLNVKLHIETTNN